MKKLVALLSLFTCTQAFSQDSTDNFNYSRNRITFTGMKILGSWGLVNVGAGAAGWAGSNLDSHKYFYQMSTFWGIVNTSLAVLGYTGAKKKLAEQLTTAGNLKAQETIEKTFLINAGLDIGYIGAGIYLNSRGNTRDNAKLKGYGSSVMMQGIFLFLFDGIMYKLQRTNGNKWKNLVDKNSITFTGNRLGIVHKF